MESPARGRDSRQLMSELRLTMREAVTLLSKVVVVIGAVSGMIQLFVDQVPTKAAHCSSDSCEVRCAARCGDQAELTCCMAHEVKPLARNECPPLPWCCEPAPANAIQESCR
jgi:hypothetical protein